ncbi:MAG: dihydrodipicolinate synthase family protein [Pirellulales bacterium]|nr:dihydrodipicolinate synthase family protein [Pirellulales bacterium]
MTTTLAGVLPVFQTPYHDDESIDWETLDYELNWLLDRGANGVVMAMVSEVLRLSFDERRQMAERVCQTIGGRGAVVISVGAESAHTAVSLACHAEKCGATAVMVIPPVSVAVLLSELGRYFRRIIESISIPVIVQDASGYVGKPMPISFQADLLKEYGPERVMFKPEATPIGPNLSALRDATGGNAAVFEGTGGIALVDSYRRGIVGTMPGAELIDGIVALWKALQQQDEPRIYRLSLPSGSLVSLQHGLDGFLAVEKYLLQKRGIFRNTIVRGPVGYQLDEETRHEVDRLFDLVLKASN